MTRRFRVDIETTWAGIGETEYFVVSDDATDEEIADEAREIFSTYCSYGFCEIKEGESQ